MERANPGAPDCELQKRLPANHLRATVVASQCKLLIRELRARGLDPEPQLAALGIRYSEPDDLRQFLSAAQFEAFLRMAVQLSGDPNIGLHAGHGVRHEDFDLFGLLLRGSDNVQYALSYFDRYRGVAPQTLDVDIVFDESMIYCRRTTPGVRPSRTLSEYFLSRTLAMARLMLGPVEPLEVRMMHPEPDDTREHRRILGDKLRFGAAQDMLAFSASLLTRPMLHRDPVSTAVLARHFAGLRHAGASQSPDLVACVRSAIREELRQGRATMSDISGRLNLTERTLRRQLSHVGTSFQRVLDEVRRDEAIRYLEVSRYLRRELAARLGFGGRAAFYRAFRRWTGMSPAEYRERHLSDMRVDASRVRARS